MLLSSGGEEGVQLESSAGEEVQQESCAGEEGVQLESRRAVRVRRGFR